MTFLPGQFWYVFSVAFLCFVYTFGTEDSKRDETDTASGDSAKFKLLLCVIVLSPACHRLYLSSFFSLFHSRALHILYALIDDAFVSCFATFRLAGAIVVLAATRCKKANASTYSGVLGCEVSCVSSVARSNIYYIRASIHEYIYIYTHTYSDISDSILNNRKNLLLSVHVCTFSY